MKKGSYFSEDEGEEEEAGISSDDEHGGEGGQREAGEPQGPTGEEEKQAGEGGDAAAASACGSGSAFAAAAGCAATMAPARESSEVGSAVVAREGALEGPAQVPRDDEQPMLSVAPDLAMRTVPGKRAANAEGAREGDTATYDGPEDRPQTEDKRRRKGLPGRDAAGSSGLEGGGALPQAPPLRSGVLPSGCGDGAAAEVGWDDTRTRKRGSAPPSRHQDKRRKEGDRKSEEGGGLTVEMSDKLNEDPFGFIEEDLKYGSADGAVRKRRDPLLVAPGGKRRATDQANWLEDDGGPEALAARQGGQRRREAVAPPAAPPGAETAAGGVGTLATYGRRYTGIIGDPVDARDAQGHDLRITGPMIWCNRCGRYASQRLRRALKAECAGVATAAYATRLSRLRAGLHPLTGRNIVDTSS